MKSWQAFLITMGGAFVLASVGWGFYGRSGAILVGAAMIFGGLTALMFPRSGEKIAGLRPRNAMAPKVDP